MPGRVMRGGVANDVLRRIECDIRVAAPDIESAGVPRARDWKTLLRIASDRQRVTWACQLGRFGKRCLHRLDIRLALRTPARRREAIRNPELLLPIRLADLRRTTTQYVGLHGRLPDIGISLRFTQNAL